MMNAKNSFIWKLLSTLVILAMLIPANLFGPLVPAAYATNTGYLSPTANYVYTTGFTNPDNAHADGGGVASRVGTANGVAHVYRDYNFPTIPADAVVQGIQVRLDWYLDSTSSTNAIRVYLSWNGGGSWTAYQAADEESTSTSHTETVGGTTDTWGRTWSASDFTNANFRVRLELSTGSTSRAFYIDWVPVQVTYNRSPNTPTNLVPANGATVNTHNPTFSWSAFGDPDTGDTQDQYNIQIRQNPGSYPYQQRTATSTANSWASNWNLPDGNYCWQVRVSDNSNATNEWSNYSPDTTCFTVSANVPPNPPTLVDPPNGEIVVTGQPTLTWNATTDPDPGDSVTGYDISIDGGAWIDVGTATNYTPGTALSNGTHTWQVQACDTHSACSTSATWNFTVNTNIIGPNQDSYTDQANANSNYGTNQYMYVRSSRTIMGTGQNRRMFLRFNLPAITTCYAGTSPSIVGATLRVYADSAPSAMRTYQVQRVTEAWTEGGITWNNQPDTTGSATDATNVNATGWIAWNVAADVEAFSDYGGSETNYGWMILDGNESESWSTAYETRFRAKEYTGSTTDPQLLIAYNCPPSVPALVSPANNAYVADNTPLLDWDAATDPDGDTLRYSVSVDGGAWTSPSPDTLTEITWSTLGEGQHNWQVRAYDGRAYRYSENWSFTVDTDTPAAPGYLNEGDPDQDYYPSTAYSLLINWGSIGDTGSGIHYEVYRSTDGGVTFPTLVYSNTGTSFTDSGTFSDNTYIFYRVRTRTGAGTYSAGWTTSDGVRIDSQDPATVTGVGEGVSVGTDDDWSRDNVYWVYWNIVADTGSGITYEVQRSVNGGAYSTFAVSGLTCDASRCWGDDPVGHSNGNIVRYQVRAINGAGRTSLAWSTPSDGITIDLALPDSSVTTGGVYKPATWTGSINGAASDPGGSGVVQVDIRIRDTNTGDYWNGTAWAAGETWVAALYTTGSWSYSFPAANLTDGHTYIVDSRATDLAGNIQTAFGNNNFTYSSTAPDAPVPTSTSHPNPALWYNDSQPSFIWNVPTSTISVQGYSIVLDQFPGTIPDTIQDTTDTSYDAATTADGVWYFHVRAQNIALTWGPAGHVRVNIDTATPQTPGSVTEENPDVDWDADGSVTVYWSAVPNTGSGITYELQRSVNGGGYTFVVSTTATSFAHNPGGYTDGNTVRYQVRATNGVGLSGGWATSDGMTIDSQTPATPGWVYEDAVAEPDRDYHNNANGAVTVRWASVTDTGSGIRYRLERQVSTNPGVWTLVAENLAGTSYADSGSYSDGDHITYRVTAVNGVGLESAPTASDGFTIDLGIPAQPAWVREGVNTDPDWDYDYDGVFTVYWAAVSDTGSGITYKLEKSVDGSDWQLVSEGIATTSYADTNPTALDGAFIRYRVTAVNGATTVGSYRLSDGITLDRETPAAPAWVYENSPDVDYDTDGAVLVNWSPVVNTGSGVTYDVQKRVDGGSWYDLASNLTATSFNDTDTFGDETLIEYHVLARNGVGRISGWTQSDGVRVDVDTPAQVTGVGEGLVVGTDLDYVNVNSFVVFWNAVSATATGDQIRYTVERNVNGSGWSVAATNVTATSWDDPQAFSNGDNVTYRVTAVNGAGTAGTVSAASDGITIDTGQPNSMVQTSGYYNSTSWPGRIIGTSSDDYAGVRYVQVTVYDTDASLYWNGTAWAGSSTWLTATDTTNWYYSLDRSNLTNGHTYSLQSRAADDAGNVEATYGVNSFTYADQGPQAPVITSTTHPDQNTWYNHNDPALSWTTVSSITVAGYAYVLDQSPGTMPLAIENLWTNSFSFTDVSDGTWYFHVRARDSANNWGPAGHYRLNIDTATPGAPASVTEESPDVDWDYDGSVTVYWTAVSNTGSGIVYIVEREVSTSPGTWVVLSNTVQSAQYLDPATGYADGTLIRYRVSAHNGVGLTGATTQSDGVTVDNDAPLSPAWVTENAADPNDEDYDPDGSVRVYWAASNDTGSGLTYRVERRITVGGLPGSWTEIASGLGSTSYLDPRANQDGETIHYRVTAVNGVNNMSATRMSDGILIDTDTPAAPAEVTENSPDIDWSLNGSVTVFWGSVADTGSGITYRLDKQVNSGAWTLVAEGISGGTTSRADSGSYTDGDVVRYRVRATNSAGTSGAWRESDGMTIDSSTVAAPGWVREENPDIDYDADGTLTVYWAAVSDTGSGITYRLEKQVGASWSTLAQGLAGTSYYDGQTQPDGTIVHYRVTAVNGVNTAGSATTSDGVTVDTQNPATPTGLGEGDVVNVDDVFDQDNTFYIFWAAVADTGSGITYDIQKRLNGGTWVAATSGVADTFWEDPVSYSNGDLVQYRVRAVNGAGLEGAWSVASSGITLDFALPDSVVTTHGFYNAYNWPGFVFGTSSDTGSDVAYVDITIQRQSDSLYWNGTAWVAGAMWRRAMDTYNWQYAFALANLTDGVTYVVRSRATDNAGNVETTYGQNSFTYSGSGPAAPTISSPTHPVQTNWYNNSNPTFNWITPTSSVPVVGYSYLLDQGAGTTPDTQADTAGTTASYTGQADGIWWFHVRARDDAGNWGPASHFRINIDTATPTAPITITEEYPDVDWDSDGSVTVYWSAVANTGSGITYRLEYSRTSSPSWALVSGAGALAVTNFTVGGFTNGERAVFRVRATNGVTLSSGWTTSDGVTFDLTTPSAPTNVGEGDVVGTDDDWDQDNIFWVFWTAVPTTPSGITYSVERNRNNSGVWDLMVTGLTTTRWDDPTAYSNGESVAYRVTAQTGAGRSSAASTPSDGLTLDFVQPGSAINTNGFYNNFSWPGSIQGTGNDDRSGVRYVDITIRRQSDSLYWTGTTWGALTWLRVTGTSNWTYTFAPGDGQTYTVQSRATDYADNVQSALGTSTFNYSSSGPGAPVISSPTHPNPAVWYNNNAPTLNWTTPTSGSGIQGYSYVLDHTADTDPDLAADTTGNTRSYSNLADGLWYFHVRAVDNANNWGPSAHYAVRVDTIAPVAPTQVTEESPDETWDADGRITVYWSSVTDASPVTYVLERSTNNGVTWVSVATGITTTSYLDPVVHPHGTYLVYHVRAVDSVNLQSGWTQSNGVTVDSQAPAQPTGVGEGDVVGTDDAWDQDNTFYAFWNAVPNTGSGIHYTIERSVNGGLWQIVQTNYAQTYWEDPQLFVDTNLIQYRITAINGVGLTGTTSAASSGITMDFSVPDSAVGTSGTYGPGSWTGLITGTATDATSGAARVHVTIQRTSDSQYWNGATWSGTTPVWLLATGTTAWTYAFGPSSGESYNVQSRATDAAGNVEVSYGVNSFSYSSNEPDSWVTTNGLYVGAAWPGHIAGTASAPMAAVSFVDITLQRASNGQYWNGAAWAAAPAWLRATGANSWAYVFAPADGETYTVTSRATDSVGNVEGIYGSGSFSYDLAAPAIATVSVASDKVYFYDPGLNADGGTVYFNSRAGEGAGQTLIVTVAFSEPHPYRMVGAAAFGDTPPADMAAPWTAQYSVEANAGTQSSVLFTAYDTLGLNDSATINFVEDNLAPSSKAYIAADATNVAPILVDWDADDGASGVRLTHLWVKFQPLGAWADTGLAMTGVSGQFAYTPTSGRGTYYFATVAQDNVSNVEPLPAGLGDDHIKFDNVPSISTATAPTYAIAAPIVITWTADAETSYTYLFYRFGDTGPFTDTLLPFSTAKSGTFEFTPTSGDGHYYFATLAIDDAGNIEPIAADGKTMTIYDTTPPNSAATSPAVWNGFDFVVEWTGDDTAIGSGIAYYDVQVKVGNGAWTGWLTRTASVSATYTAVYVGQPDATYHFRVRAADNAGHIEAWPAAENGDTTTLVHFPGSFPGKYKLYLPMVMRNVGGAQLPDLVVTEIAVTPANPTAGYPVDVAVTLKNQGNAETTSCFWVDLYINPTRLPIEINKGWFDAGSEGGLVWSLCGLGADESVTLHYNDSHYWPSYSQFAGSFPEPRTYTLYAQVDSYDLDTTYGVVYESNEQNNVYGPSPVVVGGSASSTGALGAVSAPGTRPNVPQGPGR